MLFNFICQIVPLASFLNINSLKLLCEYFIWWVNFMMIIKCSFLIGVYWLVYYLGKTEEAASHIMGMECNLQNSSME